MDNLCRIVSDQFEQQTGLKANCVTRIGLSLFCVEASDGCQYHITY